MSILSLSSAERGIVIFHIWKSLPYTKRMALAFGLILLGLIWQYFQYSLFPGVILICTGNLFLLVRGYDNRMKQGKYHAEAKWEKATESKLEELAEFEKKIKKWDISALDVTNPLGIFFFLMIIGTIFLSTVISMLFMNSGAFIFAVDIGVLLLPHWVCGIRMILTRPQLMMKIKYIKKLIKKKADRLQAHEIEYFILLKGQKKSRLPQDVKFRVKIKDYHPDFLGLYGQIVTNTVNGSSYPYFYIVLVAKRDYGLKRVAAQYKLPLKLTKEFSIKQDVETLVVRQTTTKTSGYHTDSFVMEKIFLQGLDLAERYATEPVA